MVEKRSTCARVSGAFCPCCCHPRHRFCGPCKLTGPGCLGCCLWTLVAAPVIWAIVTFAVYKPILCGKMHTQLYPEADWLADIRNRTPANWQWAGAHYKCGSWIEKIRREEYLIDESQFQEVFFPSTDGLQIQGFFLPGQNGDKTGLGPPESAPTIISVHGHGGYVGSTSQVVPAKQLQQQGFNVFLFNNQGLCKSESPGGDWPIRTYGADELTNTEGALKVVTENAGGVLPFATPLNRTGIYVQSGANGMVHFFRNNIPGIVMHGSIYDWETQFQKAADDAGLGWVPMTASLLMQCGSEKAQRGGISEENYKDQLQRHVHDPTGRKVFLIHNEADEYNLFDHHAIHWEKDLKEKGFDVEPYYPHEDSTEAGCNSHITIFYGPQRRAHAVKVCEFWEGVFAVNASCKSAMAFDSLASGAGR